MFHDHSYLLTKTWNDHENRSLINWKGLYMYINHHKGSLASCALHHTMRMPWGWCLCNHIISKQFCNWPLPHSHHVTLTHQESELYTCWNRFGQTYCFHLAFQIVHLGELRFDHWIPGKDWSSSRTNFDDEFVNIQPDIFENWGNVSGRTFQSKWTRKQVFWTRTEEDMAVVNYSSKYSAGHIWKLR